MASNFPNLAAFLGGGGAEPPRQFVPPQMFPTVAPTQPTIGWRGLPHSDAIARYAGLAPAAAAPAPAPNPDAVKGMPALANYLSNGVESPKTFTPPQMFPHAALAPPVAKAQPVHAQGLAGYSPEMQQKIAYAQMTPSAYAQEHPNALSGQAQLAEAWKDVAPGYSAFLRAAQASPGLLAHMAQTVPNWTPQQMAAHRAAQQIPKKFQSGSEADVAYQRELQVAGAFNTPTQQQTLLQRLMNHGG